MIDYQEQLKLQAYLDGELSETESSQVAELLKRDPSAAALLAELREMRKAVSAFGEDLRLPESREFFWSKIQREIERQERPVEAAEPRISWLAVLRRALVPATALATVLLLGVMVTRQAPGLASETALDDSGAFTYHDFAAGATLVWLSYPADNELADNQEAAMFE
jgi:anti-sigma factor RsiW